MITQKKEFNKNSFLVKLIGIILSGILFGLAYTFVLHWMLWIAIIPLLYVVVNNSNKFSFGAGLGAGFISGLFLFPWMIEAAERFTGSGFTLGIFFYAISSLYWGIWFGLFSLFYNLIHRRASFLFIKALAGASVWALLEWVRISIFPGVPWFNYTAAFVESSNPYAIQLLGITGGIGIGFAVALFNILIAQFISEKKKSSVLSAFILIALFFAGNYYLIEEGDTGNNKEINISFMQENLKAETRWMPESGDSLANIYYKLSKKISTQKPDIVLWTESSIPWVFQGDDDLMRMVLGNTYDTKASHIIGTLAKHDLFNDKFCNSAFMVDYDGTITGRYDKMTLLSLIEEPLVGNDFIKKLQLSFFAQDINDSLSSGVRRNLLEAKGAKIGLAICNESCIVDPLRREVNCGANLLVNLSNDAWMYNSMVPLQHFYFAVMRAIENNRYIAINSNTGYSGIVDNRGRILCKYSSERGKAYAGTAKIIYERSFYSKNGDVLWLSILLGLLVLNFVRPNKRNQ